MGIAGLLHRQGNGLGSLVIGHKPRERVEGKDGLIGWFSEGSVTARHAAEQAQTSLGGAARRRW